MANQYVNRQFPSGSGGSPYPTGRAPIQLGLEESIASVTQDMVAFRRQQIKEQNLKIEENEKMLLDALDYEPLLEASDEFAVEIQKQQDTLKDKWARVMLDRQGVLTAQDRIDLLKDKRELQRKVAVVSADIKTLEEITKQVSLDAAKPYEKRVYDVEQSLKNIADYKRDGKVGSGGAINLGVFKPEEFGAQWLADITKQNKSLFDKNAFSKEVTGVDRRTGQVSFSYDNTKTVENFIEGAKGLDSYQRMVAQNPEMAEEFAKKVAQMWTRKSQEDDFKAAVIPKATGGGGSGGSAKQPISTDYGWNLPADQSADLKRFHEVAEGIKIGDPDMVQLLISGEGKEVGDIDYYNKNGTNYIRLTFNPHTLGTKAHQKPSQEIAIPKQGERSDIFYRRIYESYPAEMKKSLKNVSVDNYFSPEKFADPSPSTEGMISVDVRALDTNIGQVISNKVRKGNEKPLNDIAKMLKALAPDHKVKIKDKSSKIEIDGVVYDFWSTGKELDKLIDKIDDITSHIYELNGKQYEVSLSKEMDFVHRNPKAKLVK